MTKEIQVDIIHRLAPILAGALCLMFAVVASARQAPPQIIHSPFVPDGVHDTRPCGFFLNANYVWKAVPFSHPAFDIEMATLSAAAATQENMTWNNLAPVAACSGLTEAAGVGPAE